ncbi:TetR/AcrR family transcriptional regulator [Ideonella sp. B7]|uniref:TetR/AcrR family transcriptional regulator n=1 Tax=Ideonella benzenivorans TaxID=2831643 RepID=UPI001CEC7588|nr:TetR/AcrR family transcriptional regulator [Ideonella benzenivorans]MCA6218047.1 TetR/AcrR family transcriptional regulator [Ideonella benzenivorans]
MRTKSEERRQHILAIAAEVFREVGFEKASMAEIASRVGGSKATLYNYFPSKDELFVAVMEHAAERLIGSVFERLQRPGPVQQVLLETGVDYLLGLLSPEMVAIQRMATHEGDRSEVGRLVYEKGISRGWSQMRDYLAAAFQAAGQPKTDAGVAAWHFKALMEAELREPRMLGVYRTAPSRAQATKAVQRALTVWLRGYGLAAD